MKIKDLVANKLDGESNQFYSLKLNELNQSSQAGVNFFFSTPAKNTNFWVKLLLCVSSDLSYRYTIETQILTAHVWFSDE